jgi:hypothetical protein
MQPPKGSKTQSLPSVNHPSSAVFTFNYTIHHNSFPFFWVYAIFCGDLDKPTQVMDRIKAPKVFALFAKRNQLN